MGVISALLLQLQSKHLPFISEVCSPDQNG